MGHTQPCSHAAGFEGAAAAGAAARRRTWQAYPAVLWPLNVFLRFCLKRSRLTV